MPLDAIARMPLVLPSAPNTIRNRVDWAMREAGLSYEISFEASSTGLLFAAVMAQLGVTILPWTAAHVEIEERKLNCRSRTGCSRATCRCAGTIRRSSATRCRR